MAMNAFSGAFNLNRTDPWARGQNLFYTSYKQWLKTTDISNPAMKVITLDEHPDSINDGYFLQNPEGNSWGDLPASYHNGAGGFSFADGHAEIKSWKIGSTRAKVAYNSWPGLTPRANELADLRWLQERLADRR
jgi:prepilin-type processing-associated H-X9-DG protein